MKLCLSLPVGDGTLTATHLMHLHQKSCRITYTHNIAFRRIKEYVRWSHTHFHTNTHRNTAQPQELLLLPGPTAVSSSCFRRFFARISFMASSMERVSLLLATGTEGGKHPGED